MASTTHSYYSSSKDPRYPSTKAAAANATAPPSSYGVFKTSSHYSVANPVPTSTYPAYSAASIPRSQASSQYYPQSHSAYTSSHSLSSSSSKSYDSNGGSGYTSSHPSVFPGTMVSSSSAMYPASPKRPHPCDQCALSFDRSHDLKRHRDSHTGAKPFECSSCNRSFTRKDALKRHQSQKQCGLENA